MAKEWTVNCKRCGEPFSYSDRAFTNSLEFGFSRPEYCPKCQKEETATRGQMGTPYFYARVIGEPQPTRLGKLTHPDREHVVESKVGKFDETRYGLTQDRVVAIADWFKDPNHRVVIVVGPTGSGKSTALPYWLVYPPKEVESDFFTRDGQILVTQPRIVAVTGITEYLGSDLMGSSIGAGFDIGYSYSEEDKADWRNAIDLVTDGKLVNYIVAGKINQYGIIIIDEAHELSENIAQILRLLHERMVLYPHMKLIIASATINAEMFRSYFEDQGSTVIEFEGKARVDAQGNPVSYNRIFADPANALQYDNLPKLGPAVLQASVEQMKWYIDEIVAERKAWGDIMGFLQGVKPIDKAVEMLRSWAAHDDKLSKIVEVYPLYRNLSKTDKDKVLSQDPKPGKIRAVWTTNIAEASVTIESMVYEIETGVENQAQFNAQTNATEVPLVLISKANAKQRWGRVGRTQNGEVFCMYTEDQFNSLFLDYPVSAVNRSSMENAVLTAKAAGIPNVFDGWLENPPAEELERSTKALIVTKALDETGSLTGHGLLVRSFSLPTKLVDLVLAADDRGIVVEIATLLPIIKNGGNRHLFTWNFKWDAYTKRDALKRHQALMAGSVDDVEFILKLYKAWDELPWLTRKQQEQLQEEDKEALREEWASVHSVNHETFLEIRKERNKILEHMNVGKKEEGSRHINLDLIPRVRMLLTLILAEQNFTVPPAPYAFADRVEPQDGSLVTCGMTRIEVSRPETLSWINHAQLRPKSAPVSSLDIVSRLFVDQVYIIGSRFQARVESVDDTGITVSTTRFLPESIAKPMESLVADDDVDQPLELEETVEEKLDQKVSSKRNGKKESQLTFEDLRVNYRCITNTIRIDTPDENLHPGDSVVVTIAGYRFDQGNSVVVVAERVPDPEPFSVFSKQHRYSDEVEVVVTEILTFPNDFQAALVVSEAETGLEVLVESEDISFTRSAFAVTQIPCDTHLTMTVEHIDSERRRVRLSLWDATEQKISSHFLEDDREDETAIVPATIIEVRQDDKLTLSLGWNEPEHGICMVVMSGGKNLLEFCAMMQKSVQEFQLGEPALLIVYRKSRTSSYVDFRNLPEKVQNHVSEDDTPGELSWSHGSLRFTGPMTYDRLYELKSMCEELPFHLALEQLYWLSNRLYVQQFIDREWYEQAQAQFPIDSVVEGTVLTVKKGGATIQVDEDIEGWLPLRKMFTKISDARDFLQPGDKVMVRILEFRPDKRELLLKLVQAHDPIEPFVVGEIYPGTVHGFKDYGMFVKLAPAVIGRVDKSQTYIARDMMLEDVFSEGESVNVRIKSIDLNRRKLYLDLKIPEYDPLSQISVGDTRTGTIRNIEQFGVFVELIPGLDGLVPREYLFVGRQADLQQEFSIGEEMEVTVVVIKEQDRTVTLKRVLAYDPIEDFVAGQQYEGPITMIKDFGLFVELSPGIEGLVGRKNIYASRNVPLSDQFEIGQTVTVQVLFITQDRKVELTMKIPEYNPLNQISVGEEFTGTIQAIEPFGLFVELLPGLDGLVPREHLFVSRFADLRDEFSIGDSMEVRVRAIRDKDQTVVLERILDYDPMANIVRGQKYQGPITAIKDFGLFVELEPGIEGLAVRKNLYASRSTSLYDQFEVGQTVWVQVLSILSDGKIDLTMKIAENDPSWSMAVGQVIDGAITSVKNFGAWVEIAPGVDGMIHQSGVYSNGLPVSDLTTVFSVGMRVRVQIHDISATNGKIGLSFVAVL